MRSAQVALEWDRSSQHPAGPGPRPESGESGAHPAWQRQAHGAAASAASLQREAASGTPTAGSLVGALDGTSMGRVPEVDSGPIPQNAFGTCKRPKASGSTIRLPPCERHA